MLQLQLNAREDLHPHGSIIRALSSILCPPHRVTNKQQLRTADIRYESVVFVTSKFRLATRIVATARETRSSEAAEKF